MNLLNIERNFREMCNNSPLNQYFFEKYILFKHILFDQFYDLVREKHPGYTDHSHKHVKSILKKANDLCIHRIDSNNDNNSEFLNIYEVYLLLMSIIFHDVAMIIETREGHAEIQDILKLFDSVILAEEEKEWIRKIVKCHTSSADISSEIPFDEKLVLSDYKIHPRFIAAMLRLADELDESKARANLIGLETGSLPKNQIIFHEISKAFDGVSPSAISESIKIEVTVRKNQLFGEYKKLNKTKKVIFVDELLDRIEKMNNERKYCMSFTKYYIEYRTIELKLFIWNDKKDKLLKTIEYTFDDNKGISAFKDEKFREIRGYKR